MPELPEVQTIVDDLRKRIRDWTVADFSSVWEKNVQKGRSEDFRRRVMGKKIVNVGRKGKYILLKLADGGKVVVHLRMTGALLVNDQLSITNNQKTLNIQHPTSIFSNVKHARHWWTLENGKKKILLIFSDVRKFGTVDFVEDDDDASHQGLCKLGVDPLDKNFDQELLQKITGRWPKRTIRQVLLDQCCIAGIGNIYASEILFAAKISPERKCRNLSQKQIAGLFRSTKKILQKAVSHRGTSISDYRDSSGRRGGFQKLLKVYNGEYGRCPRKGCSGVIKKSKLQGRSAFWCPVCQK